MRSRVCGKVIQCASLVALAACTTGKDLTAPTSPSGNQQSNGNAGGGSPPVAATASASLGTAAQTIKGWGMYPSAANGIYGRQQVADAVFKSGITFVRVQFRPELYVSGTTLSDMTLDPNNVSWLAQSLQQAQSYGITEYIVSVWSPPASMKTNGSVNGGSLSTSSEGAYVAYLVKIVQSLQAAGVALPAAISIQNEPEYSAAYSSAVYTVDQWQRVIEAARAAFDANGLGAVKLFGPETGTFGGAIWSDAQTQAPGYLGAGPFPSLASSTLNNAVGAYAFHAYGECEIARVSAGMQTYPKDAWMTEFSAPNGSTETDWMIDTYRALAAHLALLPFNYWAWWDGWADQNGSPDGGTLLGGDQQPYYSKRYWALKQLWTTVRPGWVVTPMTTTDPDLETGLGSQNPCTVRVDMLAFKSPDQGTVAVLLTNTTGTNKVIGVNGLPGATVQSYRSDSQNDMVRQTDAPIKNGVGLVSLPAHSAVLAVTH